MCSGVFRNPDRSEWGKNKKSTVFVLPLIWGYPSSGIIPVEAADNDQEHFSAIRYSKYHFIILLLFRLSRSYLCVIIIFTETLSIFFFSVDHLVCCEHYTPFLAAFIYCEIWLCFVWNCLMGIVCLAQLYIFVNDTR